MFMREKEHCNENWSRHIQILTYIYGIEGSKVSKSWLKSFHPLVFIESCHFSCIFRQQCLMKHWNLFLSKTLSFRIITLLIRFYLMYHRWKGFNPIRVKIVASSSRSLNENCVTSPVEALNLVWHIYFDSKK